MTDWIEHNGGPQPVGDDVWVEVIPETPWDGPAKEYLWSGWFGYYRIIDKHLIDAARLEGIRLGLEAAARALDGPTLRLVCDAIRALNPDTIAKEADND